MSESSKTEPMIEKLNRTNDVHFLNFPLCTTQLTS